MLQLFYQSDLSFETDHHNRQMFHIVTRMCLRTYHAPILAKLAIGWCKLFHKDRSFTSPSAGSKLWWPITCHYCGSKYEIETIHKVKNPFKVNV